MNLAEILNVAALIVVPILAVVIGQHLQNRMEKRKDKMQILRALMIARIYGWTRESVEAMNIIDIVFADDKEVRGAWKDLNDKLRVSNPDEQHLKKVEQAQYRLIEEMVKALGYKDKITWETIQNPYIPIGLTEQIQKQSAYNQQMLSATTLINNMFNDMNKATSTQEDNLNS